VPHRLVAQQAHDERQQRQGDQRHANLAGRSTGGRGERGDRVSRATATTTCTATCHRRPELRSGGHGPGDIDWEGVIGRLVKPAVVALNIQGIHAGRRMLGRGVA
jgi:hypothetical protein